MSLPSLRRNRLGLVRRLLALPLVLLMSLWLAAPAWADRSSSGHSFVSAAVKRVAPAVVRIDT